MQFRNILFNLLFRFILLILLSIPTLKSQIRYNEDQVNLYDSIITHIATSKPINGIVYYNLYDGSIRETFVSNGLIDKIQYVNKNGQTYKLKEFNKSILNGINYSSDEEEDLKYETSFILGKRQGIHKYYEKNKLIAELNFDKDNFVGVQKLMWYDSINSVVSFDIKDIKLNTLINNQKNERIFHSSEVMYGYKTEGWVDDIIIRCTYVPEGGDGDYVNGYVFDIYPNSKLKFLDHIIDGKREGLQKGWYESGELKYEILIYRTDNDSSKTIETTEKGYHKNGEKMFESSSKETWNYRSKNNGHSDERLFNEWYDTGQIRRKEESKNGAYQEICYDINGKEIHCNLLEEDADFPYLDTEHSEYNHYED